MLKLLRKLKKTNPEPRFLAGTRVKVSAITEEILEFLGTNAVNFYNQTGTVLQKTYNEDSYLVEMDNWYPRLFCMSGSMLTPLPEIEVFSKDLR